LAVHILTGASRAGAILADALAEVGAYTDDFVLAPDVQRKYPSALSRAFKSIACS